MIPLYQVCYFLDPNFKAQQFYDYLPQANKWRIKKYEDFEKKIINLLVKKNFTFNVNKENNDYCLKSSNSSKKIFEYFKKIK